MQKKTERIVRQYHRAHRQRVRAYAVLTTLSLVVTMFTGLALIKPAVTMENTAWCGLDAHKHEELCYESALICELAESAPYITEHEHDELCYELQQICALEEHAHDTACYIEPVPNYCGFYEHQHREDCYSTDWLVCGHEIEHVHTDECYVEPVVYCGMVPHIHEEACLDRLGTVSCMLPEHIHEDACFGSVPEGEMVLEEVPEFDQTPYIMASNFSMAAPMMFSAEPYDKTQNQFLETSKVVSLPNTNDLDSYKLRLESYLTGEPEISSEIPCDIVIVLDQSGSMNYCFYCGDPACDTPEVLYASTDSNNFNKTLAAEGVYYKRSNGIGARDKVFYCDTCTNENNNGCTYWYTVPHNEGSGSAVDHSKGRGYTAKRFAEDTNTEVDHSDGHKGQNAPKATIMKLSVDSCLDNRKDCCDALRESLNEFLDMIYRQAIDDNLNHRVAIVGFGSYDETTADMNTSNALLTYPKGGNSTTEAETIGYAALKANGGEAYYAQALQSADQTKGWNILMDSVGNIMEEGYTHIHKGIEMAVDIFENNPLNGENRNRVVVVFSDGIPYKSTTSENKDGIFDREGIDGNYEDSYLALEHAKTLKDSGVTVYAISIFSGADGSIRKNWGSELNANKFMHLLSSNYLSATTVTSAYTEADLNEVVRNSGSSYYLSAGTQDGLTNAFKQIAECIQFGGAHIKGMDENSIVRDVLSADFILNGDVKAWTETFTGIDTNGNYTFVKDSTDVEYTADHININGKVISVTGFNFSENFVTVDEDQGEPVPRGKRIVVEIPIKRSDTNPGGNKQATNMQDYTQTYHSAVYRADDVGNLIDVEDFDLHYVDTPTKITVIKQVKGLENPTQKFLFTADYAKHTGYESNEGVSPDSNYLAAISTPTSETKELGHTDTWTIDNLIVGSTITITEQQLAGYHLSVQIDGKSISTGLKTDNAGNTGVEITVQPNMIITFTNSTGAVLPSTGGTGTTIFYIVGAALMLSAMIALVTKKRTGRQDE